MFYSLTLIETKIEFKDRQQRLMYKKLNGLLMHYGIISI